MFCANKLSLSLLGCSLVSLLPGQQDNTPNPTAVFLTLHDSTLSPVGKIVILQCFDAVGWATERASVVKNFCHNDSEKNYFSFFFLLLNLLFYFSRTNEGGHCFGGNKINDFSRIFKHPNDLFPNLFHCSFQHVTQFLRHRFRYISHRSPMTESFFS